MKNPEEELKKCLEQHQRLLLVEKYLGKVQQKIASKKRHIEVLEKKVESEYRDIKRLDNLSINLLFRKILGDLTEQKEIEKQEYLQSVLLLKDAYKSVELLEYEEKVLSEKIESLAETEEQIEKLITLREKSIISVDPKNRSEWIDLFKKIDESTKLMSEITEAKEVGQECTYRGKKVLKLFKAASDLRIWGQRFKKRDYSMEKTVVDEAVEEFQKWKISLLKYEEELEDIYGHKSMALIFQTGKFDSFFDAYYNYLINDWIIRSKISSVISMTEVLLDEIARLYQTIESKEMKHFKR